MAKYRFYGVEISKRSKELLNELRQVNSNIVGCAVYPFDRVVEVEFASEPTTGELDQLKNTLAATKFEKVIEESTEVMP